METNTKETNESLHQEKKDKIISKGQGTLKEKSVSIRKLTQVLGRLSPTAIAVLPALFHYQAIQRQQTAEPASTKNFDSMIVLTEEARKELQ